MKQTKSKNNSKGFTLIELLIVVSIIGILAAVLINVINPRRAQNSARDGVRMANVEKLAQALETYYVAEDNGYPTCCNSASQIKVEAPTDMKDTSQVDTIVSEYIKNWPQAEGGTDFTYKYTRLNADEMLITVKTDRGTDSCLKYVSSKTKLEHCSVCGAVDAPACVDTY